MHIYKTLHKIPDCRECKKHNSGRFGLYNAVGELTAVCNECYLTVLKGEKVQIKE